ncbi:hypothetical protein PC9H_010154 [Pleurotus ostreatus]|uniref:WD40 repeat-like protein n=1 Tax=Pleurotus ostreatus TaxID=5322 RepID=A0A8H7DRB1_PLEOS|nr:uncharacterized protein PC9H_010154 [Pleurotus ostreatus]KAF7424843.1 hypothetical protein PC9H_010154 [Pleurotus ostreatus]
MSLTYELELEINTGFTQADTITCIAFSPTDLYIAAAIGTNVMIWDMAAGKLSYISPGRGACLCLAWYGEHALLAGRADGYLTQCHVIQETRVRSNLFVDGGRISISYLAISPDGSQLALGGGSHVSLWQKQDPDAVHVVWGHQNTLPKPRLGGMVLESPVDVTSLHFLGEEKVVATYRSHGMQEYTINNGGVVSSAKSIAHNAPIAAASISQDRTKVVIPNNQSGFDVYDLDNGTLCAALRLDAHIINGGQFPAQFIHAGAHIVGGGPKVVAIWHLSSQQRVLSIQFDDELHPDLSNALVEALACNTASDSGDAAIRPFRLAVVTKPAALLIYRGRPINAAAAASAGRGPSNPSFVYWILPVLCIVGAIMAAADRLRSYEVIKFFNF